MRPFISLKSLGNAYTVADLEGFPRGLRAGCKKLEGKRDQGEEPGLVLAAHPGTVSELVRMFGAFQPGESTGGTGGR